MRKLDFNNFDIFQGLCTFCQGFLVSRDLNFLLQRFVASAWMMNYRDVGQQRAATERRSTAPLKSSCQLCQEGFNTESFRSIRRLSLIPATVRGTKGTNQRTCLVYNFRLQSTRRRFYSFHFPRGNPTQSNHELHYYSQRKKRRSNAENANITLFYVHIIKNRLYLASVFRPNYCRKLKTI